MDLLYRIIRKIRVKLFPFCYSVPAFNISPAQMLEKEPLFCHSGNAGDIIFSCVLLKAFWLHNGKKVRLHLRTDVPIEYIVDHPLKNIMMSKKIAAQLIPALKMQPYISEVSVGTEFPEGAANLDAFRSLPIDHRICLIQGWYQLYTDVWLNLFEPWIEGVKLAEYGSTIVVARSTRLRSSYINYKFLAEYAKDLLFVGLPEEIALFQEETGIHCRSLTVESFDLLINIIHSCRLFIGNQGFAYSIAESVKSPRVLETNSISPNNYPLSPNGRVAIFQEQFESFVKTMLRRQ